MRKKINSALLFHIALRKSSWSNMHPAPVWIWHSARAQVGTQSFFSNARSKGVKPSSFLITKHSATFGTTLRIISTLSIVLYVLQSCSGVECSPMRLSKLHTVAGRHGRLIQGGSLCQQEKMTTQTTQSMTTFSYWSMLQEAKCFQTRKVTRISLNLCTPWV